nr:hypothetical protein BaRGS_017561 [Batillaria attramentaria]
MREGGGATSHTMSLTRQSKSKSMYGKIEMTPQDQGGLKSDTLPPNFAPGGGMEKSPSLPSLQPPVTTPIRFEDQLSGYLNKTKLAESGRRKVRKNWSQVFVVLQQSNLVFYKDHKAAEKKAGSPHGRPEGVISLLGAHVDFNPPKEVTGSSRKNTILLSVSSGSQFLLHTDDEKKIHEWLFRLKVVANDLSQGSPTWEHNSKDSSASSGKVVAASVGVGRSLSTTSDEGNPSGSSNWMGIAAKLKNFIIRRPAQEDLMKRGIIKDSVFGSYLQDLCDRDRSPVPKFVLECITAVENKGLEHDGLYRVSGNMAEIQRLRYVVDKDEGHNLLEDQWDVHTLTGALKLFFRELREPLFPLKCVGKFTDAVKKESRKDKLSAFKEALKSLPKCNYETMRVLFQHLRNLIQFSHENRMQAQNVAIVFGPTLMWAEGDFANMALNTVYQSKVVEFLLLEYDNLFRKT